MKKVIWSVFAAAASAGGAALMVRLARRIWRNATGELPPEVPWWSRLLVAGPVGAGITRALKPTT